MAECMTINASGFLVHKRQYRRMRSAKRAARGMERKYEGKFNAYKCSGCGLYHVGRTEGAHGG